MFKILVDPTAAQLQAEAANLIQDVETAYRLLPSGETADRVAGMVDRWREAWGRDFVDGFSARPIISDVGVLRLTFVAIASTWRRGRRVVALEVVRRTAHSLDAHYRDHWTPLVSRNATAGDLVDYYQGCLDGGIENNRRVLAELLREASDVSRPIQSTECFRDY